MGCLFGQRANEEEESTNDPVDKFEKVDTNRRPRDIFFCLLFLIYWIGMISVAGFAFDQGEPYALLYGLDYEGDVCATGSKASLDVQYWPNIQRTRDAVVQSSTNYKLDGLFIAPRICLKTCPSPNVNSSATGAEQLTWVCEYPHSFISSYVRSDTNEGVDYPAPGDIDAWQDEFSYDYFAALTDAYKELSLNFTGPCWPVLAYTSSVYWSCMFDQGPLRLVDGDESSSNGNTSLVNEAALEIFTNVSSASISSSDFTSGISSLREAIDDFLSTGTAVFDRYIEDLELGWPVIVVCGAVVPLGLSAVWLLLMRYLAGVFAWTVIAFANFAAIGIFLFFGVKAGLIGDDEINAATVGFASDSSIASDIGAAEQNRNVMKAFFGVTLALAVVLLVFTLLFIRRVKIAVATIKVAAKCIASIPSMIFYPILPFIATAGLFIYWIFVTVYLFSVGEIEERSGCDSSLSQYCHSSFDPTCTVQSSNSNETNICGQELVLTREAKEALVFHFFGLLWTTQFLIAATFIVLALCAARYYWYKGDTTKLGRLPVIDSLRKTMAYYLGPAAKGAFIVALLQFIRYMVELFENRLKKLVNSDRAAKWILSCVKYCLWYIQKVIEFVNKNAYIVVAVEGSGYCASASRAIKLLVNNAGSVLAVNTIGDALLFLGKIAVAGLSAFFAFAYLEQEKFQQGNRAISSPLLIVLLVFLMSYAIATVFFAVVEMAVDTILLSFCIDCEANNNQPQHAPKLLLDALGIADEQNKKQQEQSTAQQKAQSETKT